MKSQKPTIQRLPLSKVMAFLGGYLEDNLAACSAEARLAQSLHLHLRSLRRRRARFMSAEK